MIWNTQSTSEQELLASRISAEINDACENMEDESKEALRMEVARSVASIALRDHSEGCVPSGYLTLLSARALWSVGMEDDARRLMAFKGEDFLSSFSKPAFMPDFSLPVWWMLVSRHILRSSSLLNFARGEIWVLDLCRAMTSERSALELILFRSLDSALDIMAPLWDKSSGEGILGLKRLDVVSLILLKRARRSRKTEALASEIQNLCLRKLLSLRDVRGWKCCPEILRLDW